MNKSYSAHITDAKVMIDALRNNHGKVTKIDNPFIMEMERLREEVERLNSEQERLKADLKSKTEELTNRIKELDEKYTFAKKRVKVDIPQSGWKEFGIDASRKRNGDDDSHRLRFYNKSSQQNLMLYHQPETLAMHIDDFHALIIPKELAELGNIHIHTSGGEIVFFLPNLSKG